MKQAGQIQFVSWRGLAPLFADLVVSPWNLLVGGLLIQYLSFWSAIASIVIGYCILAFVFVLYGGLGFKKRSDSASILHQVFGNWFSKYVIPLTLALGQIGWTAINIGLGGTSLALLTHMPLIVGMGVYALLLGCMAAMNLYRLAVVKTIIVVSSLMLVAYVFVAKMLDASFFDFVSYQPDVGRSLLWGIGVVVASMVSFSAATPDFFRHARQRSDVVRSTILGMFLPGMIMAFLGCFLFFDQAGYNLSLLLASLAIPLLPGVLNVLTNTDGSLALYISALKIVALKSMRLAAAVAIAALVSLSLAATHMINHLDVWLGVLSLMMPVFIGVAFASVLFDEVGELRFRALARQATFWVYGLTLAVCVVLSLNGPAALFALIAPLFLYGGYIQYKLMR